MAKVQVSGSVEKELFDRLALVAKVDRRSLAEVVALALMEGLPLLEEEVAAKEDARKQRDQARQPQANPNARPAHAGPSSRRQTA
jgi:hypothetical protein